MRVRQYIQQQQIKELLLLHQLEMERHIQMDFQQLVMMSLVSAHQTQQVLNRGTRIIQNLLISLHLEVIQIMTGLIM